MDNLNNNDNGEIFDYDDYLKSLDASKQPKKQKSSRHRSRKKKPSANTPKPQPSAINGAGEKSADAEKSAPEVKPEEIKKVPEIKPEEIKKIPEVKPEEIKKVPEVKPEEIKKVHEVKPEEIEKAPEIKPEEIKKVPEVKSEEIKKAPEVKPEEIKKAPEVKPEEIKKAPEVKPKEIKKVSEVKPEEIKKAPEVKPEEKDEKKAEQPKPSREPKRKRKSSGNKSGNRAALIPSEAEVKPEPEKKEPAEEKPAEEISEHIENIKQLFDDALDENPDEIADLSAEEEPLLPTVKLDPQGVKRRLYFFLGIVVTLLAIVGLFSTVGFTVRKIGEFTDNTKQKNEFAKFIYPVVICDPAPFDKTVPLRNDTMLTAAIWDIILYEDKTKYESEFDTIIVPEVDVEQHAAKLFGTGLSFKHTSLLNSDVQFYYDEEIKSYRIPSNPKYFTYSPYIEKIERVGERYTLTVGYVSPTPAWLTLTSDETPAPEKYVNYVVSRRGNEITLISIQQSEMEAGSGFEKGL